LSKEATERFEQRAERVEEKVRKSLNNKDGIKMKKSYSLKELTEIGRKEFNLSDEWHCFMADASNYPIIRYGLSPKNENGEWINKEVYGYVVAEE